MMCSSASFFLAAAHRVDHLGDALHRGVARGDLDALRVFQQAIGQFADVVAEGGGKQQALLVLGHQGQDFLHVVDEAHVQHPVGLVQHQHFHAGQIHEALLLQVQQAARGGHQHVDAPVDAVDLRLHAHAAEDDGGFHRQVLGVGPQVLLDLGGQLARGAEDQGADAASGLLRAALRQAVQDGQRKRGGLARAGLGTGQQVMTGQYGGNGLGLNGGGCGIALLMHGLDNGRSQVQFFKCHCCSNAPFLGAGFSHGVCLAGPPLAGSRASL